MIPTDLETPDAPLDQSGIEQIEPEDVIPQEVSEAFLRIKDELRIPERFVRERFVQKLKKLEYYWNNLQYIYWDSIARDYRDYQDRASVGFEDPEGDTDPQAYAKVVNIYRAHGEAWIAALAAEVPHTRFFPEDADNPSDVSTAKAYSKLAEMIQRHNQADLLLLRALYLLFNTGVVFAYNENRESEEFGTYNSPIEEEQPVLQRDYFCPNCGETFGSEQLADPNQPPVQEPQQCQSCGYEVMPEFQDSEQMVPQVVGMEKKPKCREIIRCYGPLHVEVPHYIGRLDDTPYLALHTEEPVGKIQEIYPEFAEKIRPSYDTESVDRWARQNRQYSGEINENVCTVSRYWFRPWAYNYLGNPAENEIVNHLKTNFPKGAYVVIINDDLVVEVLEDVLDDHWTATVHPFSEHIHAEPHGSILVHVQDMVNELYNLTLETIEFGIPETFADPGVLDFDQYRKSEARPGMVYPAKALSGQNVSAGFHEIKAASLSQEIDRFGIRLDTTGQFVLGTFPTIYGGSMQGGSGTAREYELSRAQALQRLSSVRTVINNWWADMLTKAVRSYIENMKEDEKYVKEQGAGFINVWIRKSELQGKIGRIEPQTGGQFPVSWAQKRDILLQLIQLKDPIVGQILMHPENASFVSELIGLPDLYIPGDDDRNKQLMEIAQLLMAQPTLIGIDPMSGMEQFQSSVPVDREVDNHAVEAEVCAAWLKSELGMGVREMNPAGWMNVRAHYMEHITIVQEQQMMAQMAEAQAQGEGEESEDSVGDPNVESGS